jgi:hypothetical protein
MTLASGLGHTTAIAEESTYGTAPSLSGIRGFEVDSNTLDWRKNVVQGAGLRGSGLVARAGRRTVVSQDAGGDINMDFATKGMGLLLKHALGAAAITQIGATPAFRQTFTLADLRGRSLCVQTGMPLADGSLQPYTYTGCKLTDWEIAVDNQNLAKFNATLDAKDCTTGIGYAAPSYVLANAANVFSFAGASLYVAGSTDPVAGNLRFGVKGSTALKTDRFVTGQAGRKLEPVNNGWLTPVVTVDSEYMDQVTWVARNFTDETFAVVLEFVGAVISGANTERLTITCPAVKINGTNPTVSGPDMLEHTLELPVLDNGVDQPLTIEYVSTDTAA